MKKNAIYLVLITITLTIFLANNSFAITIVYSQPLYNPWSGLGSNDPPSESSDQQVADIFYLENSESITDLIWYGYFSDDQGSGVATKFAIRFYYDAGVTPVNSAPFAERNVTAVSNETGVITIGDNNNVFSYSARLPMPILLPAGTFWISIVENDPETAVGWEWSHTSFEGIGRNAVWHQNSGWTSQAGLETRADRAFILAFDPIPYTILEFFDHSVANGSLTGYGRGNSANGRLNALRSMFQVASDLIDIGDVDGACIKLEVASEKCDGIAPPPDFVTGEAVSELYIMTTELMAELGCN